MNVGLRTLCSVSWFLTTTARYYQQPQNLILTPNVFPPSPIVLQMLHVLENFDSRPDANSVKEDIRKDLEAQSSRIEQLSPEEVKNLGNLLRRLVSQLFQNFKISFEIFFSTFDSRLRGALGAVPTKLMMSSSSDAEHKRKGWQSPGAP
jgi:hypothetical protein